MSNPWTSDDTRAAYQAGYNRGRDIPGVRIRMRADKAEAERGVLAYRVAAVLALCEEAEAHTPGLIGKLYTDEIRAALGSSPSGGEKR